MLPSEGVQGVGKKEGKVSAENIPTGSITFLFTDIEGSTRLWELYPEPMQSVLARHDRLLRQAIQANHGYLVKTTGDGCHAAFSTAACAVAAALSAQKALLGETWGEIQPQGLRVRMGLHSGEAEARGGDYYGPALNRAARLMSVGHGGQILVSSSTAELVRDSLPDGSALRDLGAHRLRDLTRPEQIFQLVSPALPAEFPPLHSLDAIPNNLPIQTTSFIGREREIAETRQMLSTSRLVTLTGSGGTGKTRLSLQLAAEVLSSYPDGVWLVELAPILNPELVLDLLASTLRLQAASGIPLLDLVTDYLKGKQLLLILDNCEHLIDATAKLADHFLRTCPNLKMIASSREALGISGEISYRVPSLSLPDLTDPASLIRCESVRLFHERALAANPHFMVKDSNAQAVAQICRRLDGIPLALELAAARIKVFSAEQIASRLDDRFRLLTGGSRAALPRQQTLRALIDWSYDLLSEKERSLLRSLSVFVGGWTYEAAEAVCPNLDVLDLLTQLINKSLVIADELQDRSRYRMLETIRQYARERLLESGEMAAIRDQHFDYFLKLSKEAEPGLMGAEVFEWIDLINPDFENIRNALAWSQDQRPEDTLQLAGNLLSYLPFRTDFREGVRIFNDARTRVEALPPVEGAALRRRNHLRVKGMIMEGIMEVAQGRNQASADRLEEAIGLEHQSNDDPFLLSLALGLNAYSQIFFGDEDNVKASVLECESLLIKHDNKRWFLMFLPQLAWLKRRAGQWEEHLRCLEQALQPAYRLDHPLLIPNSLALLVEARVSGKLELAREFYRHGINLAQKMKDPYYLITFESEMAHIARQEGRFEEAEKAYRQLIPKWQEQGLRPALANQLECMAFVARALNDLDRSARLFGAAEALREAIGVPMADYERPEYDQEVAALRDQMDHSRLSTVWAEGRVMNLDQAVTFAITPSSQLSQE